MADEHWFDVLNRVLIHGAPRRNILRSAAALSAGLLLGRGAGAEAAKKKRKKKGKRKGKKKSTRCGRAECAARFTGEDLDFCQVKCGRCRIREKFCVIESHSHGDHLGWHATCCFEDEECCGTECCGPGETCCDTKDGKQCVRDNVTCCPSDSTLGYCLPGETCCPGIGCIAGSCANPCPAGLIDCGGACQECCLDVHCRDGNRRCIDGTCQCGPNTKPCDGACIFEYLCCTNADCPAGQICRPNKICGGPV